MAIASPSAVVPVLILKEGSQRTTGFEALRANVAAARAIAETVKTSLGPRGMDKMLVDSIGDITITNDGATILNEIEVQHPAAKLLVQISKTLDDEVGDGTTSAVVIAGELLREGEALIEKNVHPTLIVTGYKKALSRAKELLEKYAINVNPYDDEILKKVCLTAIHGKAVGSVRDYLAEICVKAVKQVTEERDGRRIADLDRIQIIKKQGGSLYDTKLINGIVIDKEVVHPGMPKMVKNAKIAVINSPLEIEKTEISSKISITSPEQMKAFLDEETRILAKMVDKIASVGANVVICQKGIDDTAQFLLKKKNILAVRRVKESDIEKISKATGARIITNLDDMTENDLGYADLVEERKVGEERMLFIEGCKNPKAVTILIRGGSELIVDEAERGLHDALFVIKNVLETGKVVAGGGAIETWCALKVREFAESLPSKEQLAAIKYAEALEVIPSILAETAGMEPLDTIVNLRSIHAKGNYYYGVDVLNNRIENMKELGIVDPANVKVQAIRAATEAAIMLLRIDDIISASPPKEKEKGEGPKVPEEY